MPRNVAEIRFEKCSRVLICRYARFNASQNLRALEALVGGTGLKSERTIRVRLTGHSDRFYHVILTKARGKSANQVHFHEGPRRCSP